MATDKTPAADPPATIDDALKAYSDVEKAIEKAIEVTKDVEHGEASGLRGLFTELKGVLRAGKPGGSV